MLSVLAIRGRTWASEVALTWSLKFFVLAIFRSLSESGLLVSFLKNLLAAALWVKFAALLTGFGLMMVGGVWGIVMEVDGF